MTNDNAPTKICQKQSKTKGYLAIMIAGTLWGMTGVFSNIMSTDLGGNSSTAAFYRMLGAVIMLALYIAIRDPKKFQIGRTELKLAAFQGLTTGCLFSLAYIYAIQYVGLSTAAILLYTSPVYVIILSRILFGEEIRRNKIIALIVNLMGCALTVTGGSFAWKSLSLVGILLGLAAGLCYSMMPICGHFAAERIEPETITFYSLVFALGFLLLLVRPWQYKELSLNGGLALWSVLAGLMTTALPFTLYTYGMSVIPEPSKGPVLASLENVSASIFGVMLFGEFMNAWKVCGIMLVFCSIVIINRKGQSDETNAS